MTAPLNRALSFESSYLGNVDPIRRRRFQVNARKRRNSGHGTLKVIAIDAAQPFDSEAREDVKAQRQKVLKIGIVGFGNFGQFLSKRFLESGHSVIATSRTDYSTHASAIGVSFFADADDFCEEHPDIVIFCTSILSLEATMRCFPFQRLKRNTLFCDVLSVKQFPKQLFLQLLPSNFDILCLHPMFGPDSGKNSWQDLPLVYDKVRVGDEKCRSERCNRLLSFFELQGCRMVEMSCEEHDRQAASSQFITHTVGRMLGTMELSETTISTKGFDSLMSLVDNTYHDSFDLYYGLFMYNKNASAELARLELAFNQVKGELFGRLHDVIRSELFTENSSAHSINENPEKR
jgi:arogenate dehydrogenase (NADP+), plant